MIVFRTTDSDGDDIRINFCDSGLYIQLGDANGDILELRNSIIDDLRGAMEFRQSTRLIRLLFDGF